MWQYLEEISNCQYQADYSPDSIQSTGPTYVNVSLRRTWNVHDKRAVKTRKGRKDEKDPEIGAARRAQFICKSIDNFGYRLAIGWRLEG